MKGKDLIVMGVAIVVAGCGAMPRMATAPVPTKTCTSAADCVVTVVVTVCSPGGARVDPDVIGLRRGTANIPITWKISTTLTNVTFANDGVVFKGPTAGQFRRLGPTAGNTEFKHVGVNSLPETAYPYEVRLMRGNLECTIVDPYVVNE